MEKKTKKIIPIAHAAHKKARISPRKARLVVDQVRGMNANHALAILQQTRRKANPIVRCVLQAAIANAQVKDKNIDVSQLIISEATVNKAGVLKRMRARAMGRGNIIKKYTSHVSLSVGLVEHA